MVSAQADKSGQCALKPDEVAILAVQIALFAVFVGSIVCKVFQEIEEDHGVTAARQ